MSCSRKSLNGWMILLPSASGTKNAPPLILVPADAVVIDDVADRAACLVEQARASHRVSGSGEGSSSWGSFRRSHEGRERVDVVVRVFRVRDSVQTGRRDSEPGV